MGSIAEMIDDLGRLGAEGGQHYACPLNTSPTQPRASTYVPHQLGVRAPLQREHGGLLPDHAERDPVKPKGVVPAGVSAPLPLAY